MKIRYNTLDILRAIAIITMIIYHTLWDLVNVFGADLPWFYSETAVLMQLSIRWSFVLISGFCWSLGSRQIKRGITVLLGAVIIFATTKFFTPDSIIIHGVLTLLGSAMIITKLLYKPLSKIPAVLGLVLCLLLFLLTYDIDLGFIKIGNFLVFEVPDFLYRNCITAFFGFPPSNFFSSDYVPLFPWVFAFLLGFFLFKIFEQRNWLKYLSVIKCHPLEWVGRQSLLIYLVHQPIIYGILCLIFKNYG